jgi:iron-sulfur cluster repair protein YtfE (RIC family)
MKALDLLEQDHRNVERLFEEYDAAGDAPDLKKALFERLRQELEIHAQIEEQVFYPALRDVQPPDAPHPVAEALREHQDVKDLLEEIAGLDPEEAGFDDRMSELRKNVIRHVDEEESELFEEAREHFPADRLEDMGARMEALKKSLQAGPRYRRTA